MTIFTFDELPDEEVLLEPRRVKGSGLQPVRLSVGGPFPVPLDDGSVDPDDHELRNFINHEAATHAYWLVRLACTFQAESDEPFVRAWLNLKLARDDGKAEPEPVAWSMTPFALLQLRDSPWTIKVGASAKILNAETEWHPGAKAQAAVLAIGELEATPGWEFARTDAAPLSGTQRLAFVLRAPRDVPTMGELSVDATIRRRRMGVIPHSARFPSGPAKHFRVTSAG
jgi:hypothetical protein